MTQWIPFIMFTLGTLAWKQNEKFLAILCFAALLLEIIAWIARHA